MLLDQLWQPVGLPLLQEAAGSHNGHEHALLPPVASLRKGDAKHVGLVTPAEFFHYRGTEDSSFAAAHFRWHEDRYLPNLKESKVRSDDGSPNETPAPQSTEESGQEATERKGEKREKLEDELSLEMTLRRWAEEKLMRMEEKLQLTIAGAEDHALFLVDTDGQVRSWNAGARKLFGHSNEEAIGQPFEMIFTCEDREAGVPDQELKQALANGAAGDERWHVKRDGTTFWAHGITTTLRGEGEGVRGFAKLVRDLTMHKQAKEEELRKHEAGYRQHAEELAETNRQKYSSLATFAHELRNPLAPIRMAADLIGDQAEGLAVREACSILQRQVEIMIRLVDDLFEGSCVISGKVRLQREVADVREVVRHAVDSARSAVEIKQQQLSVSLPEKPIRLDVDPIRIEQVIVNLLINATKYTPGNGKIWLVVEQEENMAVLRVRDNGEGIASEAVPTLFTLFAQAERSLENSKGGMGIGLALVRSLVEMHGGTVEAHSEGIGKGSEFVVRLPVSTGRTEAMGETAERATNHPSLGLDFRYHDSHDDHDAPLSQFHEIEAEIRYLPTAEGGRKPSVTSGYRGQFHYEGEDQPWDGLQFFPELSQEATVPVGKRMRVVIRFSKSRWDEVHSKRITSGMAFEIREGARVVGRGVVTKI